MEVVQETSLPIYFQISNETILESDKVNVNALKRKLQAAIDETLNTSPVPAFKKIPSLEQKIKDEITFFEKTETKGTYLQNVYDFLMTIVPTSVESERAFSAAGYICTKIRSSLDDETIDCDVHSIDDLNDFEIVERAEVIFCFFLKAKAREDLGEFGEHGMLLQDLDEEKGLQCRRRM
uniref:Dimer_Tnp_hAT domain-containing protein n=1 Tax=Rhodnius prolixus TaxID=13249 RepID=T1IEH5_RHOPR